MAIFITTSHRPTRRVRSFCKELSVVLPGSVYVNRGKMSLNEVMLEASAKDMSHVLVVNVRKGNPGRLDLYRTEANELVASLVCLGTKLVREMGMHPQRLTKAAVAIEAERELEALGKVLAEALGLPLVKGRPSAPNYGSLVLISPRRGYLGAINFLDLQRGRPIGPSIRIKRVLKVVG
ncbi:MAG: hypothetical protein N3H31_00235 [Candidatus Nezhaarchaeota archaeon]|nr:hypothetical protein [Candidatus Nezhaarchaeota archaeon]